MVIQPQNSFPSDLLAQLRRESRILTSTSTTPQTGYSTQTRPTVTAGAVLTLDTFTPPIGRAYLITAAEIGADQAASVFVQFSTPAAPTDLGEAASRFGMLGSGGGTVRFDWAGGLLVCEGQSLNLGYMPPTTSAPFVAAGVAGLDLTADFHYDAKRTILWVGDSITQGAGYSAGQNGTLGITKDMLHPFAVTNAMRDRGVSVRLVNKGISGMTSTQVANRAAWGWYDLNYDLMVVHIGMNDAATGTATPEATYKANLQSLITRRNRYRPRADVLLCGPSSASDPARPNLANYRQWAADVAAAAGNGTANGVYYVDLSAAYGTTAGDIATYYFDTNPSIHPNIAGHAALASVLGPAIAQTRFYARCGLTGAWA
jgi:lysophospholipase L1-like esterase